MYTAANFEIRRKTPTITLVADKLKTMSKCGINMTLYNFIKYSSVNKCDVD